MIKSRKKPEQGKAALSCTVSTKVRFSEVDAMAVVWHGNYIRFFEDAREEFGRRFDGIRYMLMFENGFTAPVVEMSLHYHQPLTIDDTAVVRIEYVPTEAAKLCFRYTVTRESDGTQAVTGESVQVFVDTKGELSLTNPEFFVKWKERWLK
jgi:Predicted thioesterase